MQKFKIGIVGNGFVGSAICKGLNHYHDVKIYDVNSAKSTHSFDETIIQDIVFRTRTIFNYFSGSISKSCAIALSLYSDICHTRYGMRQDKEHIQIFKYDDMTSKAGNISTHSNMKI